MSETHGLDGPPRGPAILATMWDARTKAIVAGADRLETLSGDDRIAATASLRGSVGLLVRELSDEWLLATAIFMIDDLCKSYFNQFRWTDGVGEYIAATAGVVVDELHRRELVLHYIFDTTVDDDHLDETLVYLPAPFAAAGFVVTGPLLMAAVLLGSEDQGHSIERLMQLRLEGLDVASRLMARCHAERRSSVYLNVDRNDDSPGLSLDAALSQRGAERTVVVFRNQPAVPGSGVDIWAPPGMVLPGYIG